MNTVPDTSAPLLPHRGTMLWIDRATLSDDHNVGAGRDFMWHPIFRFSAGVCRRRP